MAGDSQGGYVPPAPGRRIRSRLHRGEHVLSAVQTRRLAQMLRPERDQREVAAEVTRPDEPGGEQR